MELVIFSKTIRRLELAWLKSHIRKKLLLLRHGLFVLCRTKAPTADVYLALNDPYSYLLIQTLSDLSARFHIKFNLYMVNDKPSGIVENSKLWQSWALKDAQVIAKQYQLQPPKTYPSAANVISGQQLWQLTAKSTTDALSIFEQVWQNKISAEFPSSTPVITHLIKNQERQFSRGHYLPATIYFVGEWYWGVDRLSYFEQSLSELELTTAECSDYYSRNKLKLENHKQTRCQEEVIEVYLSICNPYSYVGFKKAEFLSHSYQIPLVIKPILPGVMRGRPIMPLKVWNNITDSLREARLSNISFNSYASPSVDCVSKVYSLFSFALSKNAAQEYISNVFDAIYRDNIDISITENLKLICQKSGFDFEQAQQFSQQYDWQSWVDQHHQEMEQMGLFSGPSFKFADIEVWGQDKLWQIEQAILQSHSE